MKSNSIRLWSSSWLFLGLDLLRSCLIDCVIEKLSFPFKISNCVVAKDEKVMERMWRNKSYSLPNLTEHWRMFKSIPRWIMPRESRSFARFHLSTKFLTSILGSHLDVVVIYIYNKSERKNLAKSNLIFETLLKHS